MDSIDQWLRSDECRDAMQDYADQAAAIWAEKARKRTGRMATDTSATTILDGGRWEGLFMVDPFYARYQEEGTEDVRAMHITDEIAHRLGGVIE